MRLRDSENLQNLINQIYPSFNIQDVAKDSGQRVVYFGNFSYCPSNNYHVWGDVVLKISESKFRAQISYLQKEIEMLKIIKHPSYPRIFAARALSINPDADADLENIFFISIEEKKDGKPLSELITQYCSEFQVKNFLKIIIPILEVLWLHPKKIVHRDLKPDNILINEDDSICIIDLGILRETGSEGLTFTGQPFGPCTPLYASPEQAMNDKRNISFKSDLFSLGIIAYEMLAKKNPFKNENDKLNDLHSILDRICLHNPPDLYKTYGITPSLSQIVHRMIEKQPYKRFRTSKQLLNDLEKEA